MIRRIILVLMFLTALGLAWAVPRYDWINPYWQLTLTLVGINMILALSLNLVNGYMGEFSVGHAGFMAVGAYVAAMVTVMWIPEGNALWRFPLAVLAGGMVAAFSGLLVAFPSFRARGDYLAIVTLAFNMIVKSVLENLEVVGASRGLLGIEPLNTPAWTLVWLVISLWCIRNIVYSRLGRGIMAIREDETAAELMGIDTRHVKILAFVASAFFAGIAGGLFAHQIQFINPKMFDIIKSTDILVMVYLGGAGSLVGSLLGAGLYTVLLEVLRPLGAWRMFLMPLLLVILMLFRPSGIMGLRDWGWLKPSVKREKKP